MRGLSLKLLEGISESLGLERDYIEKALGKHGQHMAVNYYPPCPEPELTYGLPPHADPNAITILLQNEVPGLQVLHQGNWLSVNPVPNTFIVNIGDQIQVDHSLILFKREYERDSCVIINTYMLLMRFGKGDKQRQIQECVA